METTYTYKINPKLFGSLYCPTCKSKLKRKRLIDIFSQGLICKNNHHFFIELKEPSLTESAKCPFIKGPIFKKAEDVKLIKSWLTNFTYRSKLNGQLAVMIRRIYEIYTANLHIPNECDVFKYCPLCAKSLKEFEQRDIWVQGLRCNEGHKFFDRLGSLRFQYQGEDLILETEMSDEILHTLLKSWLKRDKVLETQLHRQIKSILINYKEK